ncbi:MAG TPA: hypothetical protein DCQ56_07960 [Porphyromonadaceae bacterium]|nr:hypothetical protein [Porphyromonadaceae bacterium]
MVIMLVNSDLTQVGLPCVLPYRGQMNDLPVMAAIIDEMGCCRKGAVKYFFCTIAQSYFIFPVFHA